jgi:hypothetical protein
MHLPCYFYGIGTKYRPTDKLTQVNIGILTVNIEFMWLGMKRMERLTKARLSPVSKPRHINSIFIREGLLYMTNGGKTSFSESFHPFHAEPHKFYIYHQYTNIAFILQ